MLEILALDDFPDRVRRQWYDSKLENLAILHPVDEVTTLEEAIAMVEYFQPDVILLDYYMGSITGDVVLKELEERWPDKVYFGNSSEVGKFVGIVNVDKDAKKLFDAMIPLIEAERQEEE